MNEYPAASNFPNTQAPAGAGRGQRNGNRGNRQRRKDRYVDSKLPDAPGGDREGFMARKAAELSSGYRRSITNGRVIERGMSPTDAWLQAGREWDGMDDAGRNEANAAVNANRSPDYMAAAAAANGGVQNNAQNNAPPKFGYTQYGQAIEQDPGEGHANQQVNPYRSHDRSRGGFMASSSNGPKLAPGQQPFALRSESERRERVDSYHWQQNQDAQKAGAKAATPISSTRTPTADFTSEQSAAYRARAMANQPKTPSPQFDRSGSGDRIAGARKDRALAAIDQSRAINSAAKSVPLAGTGPAVPDAARPLAFKPADTNNRSVPTPDNMPWEKPGQQNIAGIGIKPNYQRDRSGSGARISAAPSPVPTPTAGPRG
jgi:hypothetical protein